MYTRYFRKKDSLCKPEAIEWIEMSGEEYYHFITDPKNKNRYFVDMGDVVLEATVENARSYKAEQNHHYYIQSQEEGWCTLSIYAVEDENGCSGEEVVRDESQDVETEVILRIEKAVLQNALNHLDSESYQLIHALYLADTRKTLRQLSLESNIPVMTLQDRKKKVLAQLSRELLKKKF